MPVYVYKYVCMTLHVVVCVPWVTNVNVQVHIHIFIPCEIIN